MSTDRSYDNTTRAESARLTRQRIVGSARDLLLGGGYHSMSIADLARGAGVSPQTVYNAVGGKAAVVKAVYDTMLAGDDAPIAMQDRPEFQAMSTAPDHASFMRAYADVCSVIYARVGPLLGVLLAQGAGNDAGLSEFVSTIDTERRNGNTNAVAALERVHGLPEGLDRTSLLDNLWVLSAPEIYDRFVRRCGWSHDRYRAWLSEALVAAYDGTVARIGR